MRGKPLEEAVEAYLRLVQQLFLASRHRVVGELHPVSVWVVLDSTPTTTTCGGRNLRGRTVSSASGTATTTSNGGGGGGVNHFCVTTTTHRAVR